MARYVFFVDLNKPLVFQVGHLGEAYKEWVHRPVLNKQTPQLFATGVIEFFSRTPIWAIPLVWLPVMCLFVSSSLKNGIAISHVAPTMVAGVILWTLLEYLLHRFLFHIHTSSYWGNTLHYTFHGCHHKHPMDGLHLVFPPLVGAVIALLIWNSTKLFIPAPYSYSLFGGILLGYIIYDCTHYYLHHGKPLKGVFYQLKKYHMNHHLRNLDKGFGVTTTFWDWMFGTLPPKSSLEK